MKFPLLLVAAACALAQDLPPAEEQALRRAVQQAGQSTPDLVRALENHLEKFPESPKRAEFERALFKGALELADDARIVRFGERVLAHTPTDALAMEAVSKALLKNDDRASAGRALQLAQGLEEAAARARAEKPDRPQDAARRREDLDKLLSEAFLLQARALGKLGRLEEAAALAERAFEAYPAPAQAREAGRAHVLTGNFETGVRRFADAYALGDPRDAGRARDRRALEEAYTAWHGSAEGLGDFLLAEHDRMTALLEQRRRAAAALFVNAGLEDPMRFTLSGVNGEQLALSSLLGKVVILDFWATWCGPCRAQYPEYETVKQRFAQRRDIVFLSISTDTERDLVKPFLEKQRWNKSVYFEDGLSALLRVSAIPSTIIFGKDGKLASRINGFVPGQFTEQLTERIRDILKASE
jgi:thiol-disulfide isomerase/thioredoxin